MRLRTILAVAAAAIAVSVVPVPGHAGDSAGTLDPSFSEDGIVITNLTEREYARGIALQSDGGIIVAVQTNRAKGWRYTIVRYLSDGSVDASFGDGGSVTIGFGWRVAEVSDVAVQSDDRIVVVGTLYDNRLGPPTVGVARLLPDGQLDRGFGRRGKVVSSFDRGWTAAAIAIQSDGKIVIAGQLAPGFGVARFTKAGELDPTFSMDGVARGKPGRVGGGASAVAVAPDGAIVVGGTSTGSPDGSNWDAALMRFSAHGVLDHSFGRDGRIIVDATDRSDSIAAMAFDAEGRIVTAGAGLQSGSTYDTEILRFTSDGHRDRSFGDRGVVIRSFGVFDSAGGIAVDAAGRLVVSVSRVTDTSPRLDSAGVVRFLPSGELDGSFGVGGLAMTDLGCEEQGSSLAQQPDGNLLVAGFVRCEYPNSDITLERYNAA